jgi:hypothetical protein
MRQPDVRLEFESGPSGRSRRAIFWLLLQGLFLVGGGHLIAQQEGQVPEEQKPKFPEPNEDPRLPDGKSQKNAIAKEQHEQALKDADDLVSLAQQLRDEIQKAGNYVVPLDAVKRTEQIEKLAKRVRGRLKS